MIDLRSDTITRPTEGMLKAMQSAVVGDDVFGDDPTVNLLQEKIASLFDYQDALFCVSGTMANQIAIQVHTQPGDQVICDRRSHIYLYEGGGIARNAGCSVDLLDGERGLLTANIIRESLKPKDDVHFPKQSLVSLENTMNKGGGATYKLEAISEIKTLCESEKFKLHLDGARLFNALVANGQSPKDFGKLFDSISICLSKGLGCPVGSVLLGNSEFIKEAKRVRKVMGGGWRQAGYLAAAGLYAIDHHVERLAEDHENAKLLAHALHDCTFVKSVLPTETNIVIFELVDGISSQKCVEQLKEKGVLAVTFGEHHVRFVTHLDNSKNQIEEVCKVLKTIKF